MSKISVTDMAGEFGVTTDEVISMLRQMDVPVRGHSSQLTDDQVARARLLLAIAAGARRAVWTAIPMGPPDVITSTRRLPSPSMIRRNPAGWRDRMLLPVTDA